MDKVKSIDTKQEALFGKIKNTRNNENHMLVDVSKMTEKLKYLESDLKAETQAEDLFKEINGYLSAHVLTRSEISDLKKLLMQLTLRIEVSLHVHCLNISRNIF